MTVKEFIKNTFKNDRYSKRPLLICNDGFSMSVQATNTHYCNPRKLTDEYEEVEVGYPNMDEVLIKDYAEDPKNLTNSVYGYVPVELLEQVIIKHQGINIKETFKQ